MDSSSSADYVALQIFLISMDLVASLVTFGWVKVLKKKLLPPPSTTKDGLRTVPIADDPSHRVHPDCVNARIETPSNGASTLYEIVEKSFAEHAGRVCMRRRDFLRWRNTLPGTAPIKEFGPDLQEWTYRRVEDTALRFGAALRAAGCVPSDHSNRPRLEKVVAPCRIAIFENTCPEWMMAALGAFSQSIGVATVYATLGLDSVVEAIRENAVPVLVCNRASVEDLAQKASLMPCLKHIVYTDDLVEQGERYQPLSLAAEAPSAIRIHSFDDFVASGNPETFPVTPPSPQTTAVVMYTSGSTGKPKGAVISHANIVAGVAAAEYLGVAWNSRVSCEDAYLAYLPLAHIMELMTEFSFLYFGASLNYTDPKALSISGAYPTGALEVYKPTHMAAVPKIWETIKKGILTKLHTAPPIAQKMIRIGLSWRAWAIKHGLDTPLFNALVFGQFKAGLGGRLRWAVSGGGPLNPEVQDFIRVAFGLRLIQGYGLTETCAGLSCQDEWDDRCTIAGTIIPTCEVKLASTTEIRDKAGLPYLSTDRKDVEGNSVCGRGEILVRGANVISGYYAMPETTNEVFTKEGWFHTGDIGQFMEDGSIRIVDRKKNLVKIKAGEYVALEKMEMVYGNSDFVDAIKGGICCYADGDMDRPVAMLQLNEGVAMKWAKSNGLTGEFDRVRNSKELLDTVMESFQTEHAKSDLSRFETIGGIWIMERPWTPENGLLTAANKLQRRAIVEDSPAEFIELKKKGIFK